MPHGSGCGDACAGCERNQPARATPAFLHPVTATCLTRSGRSLYSSRSLLEFLGIAAVLTGLVSRLPRLACCAAPHLPKAADGLSRCLAQSVAEAAGRLSKTAGSLAGRAP
jgi:hypothetical protein